MLDPSKNPTLGFCVVKGHKCIKKRDGKRKSEGEKEKSMRETKIKRERREMQCRIRNKHHKEVRKDLKSGRECFEGRHKSKTEDRGSLSATETEGAIKKKEEKKRWSVIPLQGEGKRAKNMKGMRWHRISLWFMLLIVTLCPKNASSQVRVAFKSKSYF